MQLCKGPEIVLDYCFFLISVLRLFWATFLPPSYSNKSQILGEQSLVYNKMSIVCSIQLYIMDLNYWPVRSSSRRGEEEVKTVNGVLIIIILAWYERTEYMKICCNIQVIIYRLLSSKTKIFFNQGKQINTEI